MTRLSLSGILAVILSFSLAGCAGMASKVQEVKVPLRPAFAVDGLPVGSSIWEQMKALRVERKQRQGYEAELEAAVKACQ